MARPREARLNRAIIGRAAIDLVDSEHELHLVPLAERLGVSVSSLYHHVRGRDGVIRAMRHVLAAQYLADPAPGGDWRRVIRDRVERVRRMYTEHPRAFQLLITVVIDEPDTLHFYDTIAVALTEAGLPEEEILAAVEVVDAFSFGAALDALSPDKIFEAEPGSIRLAELLPAAERGEERNRRVYELGLDLIIAGIEARVARMVSRRSCT